MKSVDRFCERITEELIQNQTIKAEDKEIYLYSFNTIIETAMNLIGVAIIGMVLGVLAETVIMVGVIMGVRSFSGGYHAKTTGACFLLSELSYFLILLCNYYSSIYLSRNVILIAGFILAGVIYQTGPVSCETKIITEEEYPHIKRKLAYTLLGANGALILFAVAGWKSLASVIVMCFIYIFLLEETEKIKNYFQKKKCTIS